MPGIPGFLKIPDVPGDAGDPQHAQWIEVQDVFDNEGKESDKPAGAPAKPPVQSHQTLNNRLTITKVSDRATPELRIGRHWNAITIDTTRGAETRRTRYEQVTVTRTQSQLVQYGAAKMWGERIEFAYVRRSEGEGAPGRPGAAQQSRCFLQVPGVPGDSKESAHSGWIELRDASLAAEPSLTMVEATDAQRIPEFVPVKVREDGVLTVEKKTDSASPKLQAAFTANASFSQIVVDFVTDAGTQRITLEDVLIVTVASVAAPPGERYTFSYARHKPTLLVKPVRKPAVHAVTRAHAAAVNEHSTINLRLPKFFELALPVLTDDGGKRIYPPPDAVLRLVSNKGYDRSLPVARGMITQDEYCSFRFYDISEKGGDELFTATLQRAAENETVFKDRRIATYIQAARKTGTYETAFPPAPETQPASGSGTVLLPPVNSGALAGEGNV